VLWSTLLATKSPSPEFAIGGEGDLGKIDRLSAFATIEDAKMLKKS
jgi:hypothetical protein